MKTIDQKIGQVMRARRATLGLSQQVIGERIGVTFQQVQKYENGSNALTLSRLYDVAAALEWNVMSMLTESESAASHSNQKTRQTLEVMKRIKLLSPNELVAVTALLNNLCRGRVEV